MRLDTDLLFDPQNGPVRNLLFFNDQKNSPDKTPPGSYQEMVGEDLLGRMCPDRDFLATF